MESSNTKLVFVLGREQKLALAELEAVLDRFGICYLSSARHGRDGSSFRISGNLVFANIQNFSNDDAKKLINVLAGTVKSYSLLSSSGERSETRGSRNLNDEIPKQVRDDIVFILKNSLNDKHKVNFGVSNYTGNFSKDMINKIGIETKIQLKRAGYKTRFVALTDGNELTTIQSLKNKLDDEGIEIGIFDEGIGTLIALNNPEKWNERDYGKPASDKYSGMTPPKLARTMVNLALEKGQGASDKGQGLSNFSTLGSRPSALVVDPFCGSGNILMEAMMLGCEVVGSDISSKAVENTKKNLEWLSKGQGARGKGQVFDIFQSDATANNFINIFGSRPSALDPNKNLVFVTEPFLGQPKKFKSTYNATVGEYTKVKDLYLKFLQNCLQLTTDNLQLILCIIFPLIETSDKGRFSLYNECVDEIKKLGYTQTRNPFIYGRDYQVVKREIVLLQLKQK